MRKVIALLLGALLLTGCGSATPTQAPAPPTNASTASAEPTATSEAAKRFGAALEKAGFKGAQVVPDYDDTKSCAQYASNSKHRCVKWKTGAKLVGYDSFYTISGCEVELETDQEGKAWKVDSVNDKNAVLEGSPTKDNVVTFIKKRNDANPSPADDLCNVA